MNTISFIFESVVNVNHFVSKLTKKNGWIVSCHKFCGGHVFYFCIVYFNEWTVLSYNWNLLVGLSTEQKKMKQHNIVLDLSV